MPIYPSIPVRHVSPTPNFTLSRSSVRARVIRADTEALDVDGRSVLALAASKACMRLVIGNSRMRAEGGEEKAFDIHTHKYFFSNFVSFSIVSLLAGHLPIVDPERCDDEGRTPLILAINNGSHKEEGGGDKFGVNMIYVGRNSRMHGCMCVSVLCDYMVTGHNSVVKWLLQNTRPPARVHSR